MPKCPPRHPVVGSVMHEEKKGAEAVMLLLFKAALRTGGTETVSYLLRPTSGDWSDVSG